MSHCRDKYLFNRYSCIYNGGTNGYAAYKVANSVTSHEAWGLGSYCYFNVNPGIIEDHSFEVPTTSGVKFHDMVTVSLGGTGTIAYIINTTGDAWQNCAQARLKLVACSLVSLFRHRSLSSLASFEKQWEQTTGTRVLPHRLSSPGHFHIFTSGIDKISYFLINFPWWPGKIFLASSLYRYTSHYKHCLHEEGHLYRLDATK